MGYKIFASRINIQYGFFHFKKNILIIYMTISKESDNETTVSRVRLLTPEERVQEIAKMLAGDNVTEAALSQARALLKVDDSL